MPNFIYASCTIRGLACPRPAALNTFFERLLAALQLVTVRPRWAVNASKMCDSHGFLMSELQPLTSNIVRADCSVARKWKKLVTYQWSGKTDFLSKSLQSAPSRFQAGYRGNGKCLISERIH